MVVRVVLAVVTMVGIVGVAAVEFHLMLTTLLYSLLMEESKNIIVHFLFLYFVLFPTHVHLHCHVANHPQDYLTDYRTIVFLQPALRWKSLNPKGRG